MNEVVIDGVRYVPEKKEEPKKKQDIREYCKEHRVWAAKDLGDGQWYAYTEKPIKNTATWNSSAAILGSQYICGSWQNMRDNYTFPDVPWDKSLIAPDGSMPLLEKKEPKRATRFEVGKWYVNVGENESVPMVDQKQAALDGKPHKVIGIDNRYRGDEAWEFVTFTGVGSGGWNWNPKDWIEVPEPKAEKADGEYKIGDWLYVKGFEDRGIGQLKEISGIFWGLYHPSWNGGHGLMDSEKYPGQHGWWYDKSRFTSKTEKYVPKKDDPIFAWDKGFDKRCPCPVYYVHHVDENGRVWDYMDGKYCEEGIDYDYYRKYDPALVGVPMNRWPKE